MFGGAFAQVVADLAAIDFGDLACLVKNRHDQAAAEVFVPTFPVGVPLLETGTDLFAGLVLFYRQSQA